MSATVTPRSLGLDGRVPLDEPRAAKPGLPAQARDPDHHEDPSDPAVAQRDRRVMWGLVLGMLVFYGLLQNPYWVPSGDSEVYLASARELALGHGYAFNGQPVAIIPPGWPALLALVMLVTPYILPLKLLAMACVIGSLALSYRIARRFASPRTAALSVALAAATSSVYQATFWLISEGLFCLLSAGSILVAMQIVEGRRGWRRIGLLLALCAAAVSVRWAGLLGWLLVAAVLVSGHRRQALVLAAGGAIAVAGLLGHLIPGVAVPTWAAVVGVGVSAAGVAAATTRMRWWDDRRWIATLLSGLVTISAFWVIRQNLALSPEQAAAVDEYGGASDDMPVVVQDVVAPPVSGSDTQAAGSYSLVTGTYKSTGYGTRLLQWGRWISLLYFQPFRAAAGSMWIEHFSNGLGWLLLAALLWLAAVRAWRGQWLWLGVMLYCAALALNWPFPTARYLVPLAPLLTLGLLLAGRQLAIAAGKRKRIATVATASFITVVAACNLSLWAVDVRIARSSDFYERYETGIHAELIAAGLYLRGAGVEDREVAVTPRYVNLNRARNSPFGLRVTNLLTGRAVISLPRRWHGTAPSSPRLSRFLYRQGIRYYIHQTPVSPWRVWHFRVGWWQRMRTGQEPLEADSGWELYRVDGLSTLTRIDLPQTAEWPVRVPGLLEAGPGQQRVASAAAAGDEKRDDEQH